MSTTEIISLLSALVSALAAGFAQWAGANIRSVHAKANSPAGELQAPDQPR